MRNLSELVQSVTAPMGKQRADYKKGLVRVKNTRPRPIVERTGRRRTGRPAHVVRWEQEARVRMGQRAARAGIEGLDYLGRQLTWRQVFSRALRAGVPAEEMLSRNARG